MPPAGKGCQRRHPRSKEQDVENQNLRCQRGVRKKLDPTKNVRTKEATKRTNPGKFWYSPRDKAVRAVEFLESTFCNNMGSNMEKRVRRSVSKIYCPNNEHLLMSRLLIFDPCYNTNRRGKLPFRMAFLYRLLSCFIKIQYPGYAVF